MRNQKNTEDPIERESWICLDHDRGSLFTYNLINLQRFVTLGPTAASLVAWLDGRGIIWHHNIAS